MDNSQAVTVARVMRDAGPDTIKPHRLYELAGEDADDLLERWHAQAKGGASMEIALHLDRDGLAAAIYRHAMIEAGAVIRAEDNEHYDPCPRCGHDFS